MCKLLLTVPVLLLALPILAEEKPAKGDKVDYQVYTPYFEKNTSGLKGDVSYLAVTNRKGFDALFGVARTMGPRPEFLPADAFEKKMVVGVIKRGNAITTYKVDGVTAADGVLRVSYTATTGKPGSARFASPLVIAVPRGACKSVEFVENGKKVGMAEIGK